MSFRQSLKSCSDTKHETSSDRSQPWWVANIWFVLSNGRATGKPVTRNESADPPDAVHKSKVTHGSAGADLIGLVLCIIHAQNGAMLYGYARVSTGGQNVAAQVAQLTEAGAKKIFKEVASGAKSNRAQLQKALAVLDEGDVLMVTRLDRQARSTRDLLNVLALVADKKAGFRSIGDAWADTTTPHGRLMLTVLGGLAEFERDLIRARTGEGRERAKARGVKLGRKPKLTPHQRREALARRERGEESLTDIGRSFNVSHSTISRLVA
jgi:DNA invertase Pin-like site-specific DNA recombinase